MKKYDFNAPVERRGTDSIKWDVGEGELPMWVADMDFKTAPEVTEALIKRAEHGVFGYADVDDEWYDAYIGWWRRRHGFEIKKEWIMFCTGVIPALSSIVRKLATPNENVLVQTPVYNHFFTSIANNGCRVSENVLTYKDGEYSIDFDDLEKKLFDPQTSLMMLCNPHNPVGKIWDRETLAKIGELAFKHGVTVISDEIHCDITRPGTDYIPFASVSETCKQISITCIAPTKAFNIAGLQSAAVFVPDPKLRHKVWRGINTDEVGEPNVFARVAPVAAFNEGEEWLDEMREYVWENRAVAERFVKDNVPDISIVPGDATYLLWLDLTKLNISSREAYKIIREKTGLFVTDGAIYGKGGDGFLRMNVACPRAYLDDGLERLKRGIDEIKRR